MDNLSNSVSNTFKKLPVIGALWTAAEMRPRLAAWIVLSLGIVLLLLVEARDVGLLLGQWIALIVASVLVAGLCIWIVSWEDNDEEKPDAPVLASASTNSTSTVSTTEAVTTGAVNPAEVVSPAEVSTSNVVPPVVVSVPLPASDDHAPTS